MKTFTFRYDPTLSLNKDVERIEKVIRTGVPSLRPDEITTNSLDSMMEAASSSRMRLFYAIAQEKPASVYQLAQVLKRDPANVLRDVRRLESYGLIELVAETTGERSRARPAVKYDRIVLDFGTFRRSAP